MSEEQEIREARAAYAREYRRKNPDKIRAIQNRYWAKRAEKKQKEEGVQHGEASKRSRP